MKKLEMHSESLINENIAKLAELFPECVTEVVNEDNKLEKKVDFDAFKSLFKNSIITENKERYQFTWPGKLAARAEAFIPTDKSLRPCKEESVNFDTTENLYIEGDNLTVLKLLRHTYHGKIKMIYIDPPYNTGNDFVYNDQFKQNKAAYDQISGEYDELGNRLYTNTAGGGHFHTNWLNMMYPRLLLARDLLSKDGVIFISIDDNELENIKQVCNELFGENNFIANIVWKHTQQSKNDELYFSRQYNHTLVYSKNKANLSPFHFGRQESDNKNYSNPDNDPKGLWRSGDVRSPNYRKTLCFPIIAPNGNIISPPANGWRWSEESIQEKIQTGEIKFKDDNSGIIRKIYLCDQPGRTPENLWEGERFGTTRQATSTIKRLFDGIAVFDTPKPVELIERMLEIASKEDSVILDFFSGSATTAHAVIKLNSEDGGHRKFIMVQVPEKCDENSEAYKAGYKNICEIGKERIRRAGKQILDELNAKNEGSLFEDKAKLDVGFRVFKQSDSMLADLSVKPEEADQLTFKQMSSKIRNDRTPEDLLFYSMLELGVPLSEKIDQISIGKHSLFKVENANLIACFDQEIDEAMVTEVAKLNPDYFILREDAMDDSLINNIDSIFKVYSKNADVEDRIRIL